MLKPIQALGRLGAWSDDPRTLLAAALEASGSYLSARAGRLEAGFEPAGAGPRWRVDWPPGSSPEAPGRHGTGDPPRIWEEFAVPYRGESLGTLALAFESGDHEARRRAVAGEVCRQVGYQLRRLAAWRDRPPAVDGAHRIVGVSPSLAEVDAFIERVGALSLPVSIQGEPGTEKDFVALALHRAGGNPARPFAVVRCAAIERHRAPARLAALLSRARGGTLYLRGIDDLALDLQRTLALALADLRTGRQRAVRIVVSSSADLASRAKQGEFDRDLLDCVHCLPVEVPPLRRRTEDLEVILRSLTRNLYPDGPPKMDPRMSGLLRDYAWPGNLAELENIVLRLARLNPADRWTLDLAARCVPELLGEGHRAVLTNALATRLLDGDLGPLRGLHPGVQRAVRQLVERGGESRSLAELARLACVSTAYLSTLFQQTLGQNFRDLRAALRVERARRLFVEAPHRTVSEVCFAVGYGGLSAFERSFRRWQGCSPQEFRRQLKRGLRSGRSGAGRQDAAGTAKTASSMGRPNS